MIETTIHYDLGENEHVLVSKLDLSDCGMPSIL